MNSPYRNENIEFEPVNHIPNYRNRSYWKKVIVSFLNQPKENVKLKLAPDMSIRAAYCALHTTIDRAFKGKVMVHQRSKTLYLSKVTEGDEE